MMKPSFIKQLLSSSAAVFAASILLFFPLVASFFSFLSTYQHIRELEDRIVAMRSKSSQKAAFFQGEQMLLDQIQKASPLYVETALCPMVFLQSNRQQHQFYLLQADSSSKKSPHDWIREEENRLEFLEIEKRLDLSFQETELQQKTPLFLNTEDLKNLVLAIEKPPVQEGAPQMVISSFSLEKTHVPENKDELYKIELKLIKREGRHS